MLINKGIFLDRDGVINEERGEYTFRKEDFKIIPGVREGLNNLKLHGFFLVIITNQAGLTKGIYSRDEMNACHQYMLKELDHVIDAIYYSPYHPSFSNSLLRKPDSLMFEKAISKFKINPHISWMIGDQERDIIPAKKLGMKAIKIDETGGPTQADFISGDLFTASNRIMQKSVKKTKNHFD